MSKIEWTERTWNPIVAGCSIVSEGCTNCYAMAMASRLEAMGLEKYRTLTRKTAKGKKVWNGKVNIDMNDEALYEPLKRKKPTMYFVNSMTDLFHPAVPFEAVDKIMPVIALCPQHTFQVLTKRPERMKEYFKTVWTRYDIELKKLIMSLPKISNQEALNIDKLKLANEEALSNVKYKTLYVPITSYRFENFKLWVNSNSRLSDFLNPKSWNITGLSYKNLWLGVSVENQEQADKRIPFLLNTPAAVRFLSCEPLLGSVNLQKWLMIEKDLDGETRGFGYIDWVIVGGESGHNARPMQADWVRFIQEKCKAARVAFFFKQWGEYNEHGQRVGKKAAGRLLDGQLYEEMPTLKTFQDNE